MGKEWTNDNENWQIGCIDFVPSTCVCVRVDWVQLGDTFAIGKKARFWK